MANAMMAFQSQAQAWIGSTRAALSHAGHGFSSDDLAAISASAAAHPVPEGPDASAEAQASQAAAARDLARQAAEAVYPPNGFDPSDPRLAPVEGVSLALAAMGARAIGWSTDDAHIDRVVAALGVDREVWDRAAPVLRERVAGDVVLAAFYGQLYAAA